MCARHALRARLNRSLQKMAELGLDASDLDGWDRPPAYNICPTQHVATVRPTADAGRRDLVPLKWGPIPS